MAGKTVPSMPITPRRPDSACSFTGTAAGVSGQAMAPVLSAILRNWWITGRPRLASAGW
ncbi:hypothetical protein D3C72_1804810 [compost metagenome]